MSFAIPDLGSNLAVLSAVTSHENLNKSFHDRSLRFLSAKSPLPGWSCRWSRHMLIKLFAQAGTDTGSRNSRSCYYYRQAPWAREAALEEISQGAHSSAFP